MNIASGDYRKMNHYIILTKVCHPRQVRSEGSNADQGSSANAISEANDSLFSTDSGSKQLRDPEINSG